MARAWGTTPWELRSATVAEHRAMCDLLAAEYEARNRHPPPDDDDD